MVAAVGGEVTRASTLSIVEGGRARVSGVSSFAVAIYPAEYVDVAGARAMMPVDTAMDAEVSHVSMMVVARGTVGSNAVRAWAFSLDGHDFYVLTLGDDTTLVYDQTTGQWAEWTSPDLNFWRVHRGMNWLGMGLTTYTSSTTPVIAGDSDAGILWLLDPESGYDENPNDLEPTAFDRMVVGGVPMRLRETQAVGAVYLTASIGNPQLTGANITLRTSDDAGRTWTDHGTITAEDGNYTQEFVWRSLGLIRAPGRLFEITDDGASVRIDSLDMR